MVYSFVSTCVIGFVIAGIISAVAILTDKTPESTYDLLAGKTTVWEDWFHE